MRLRVSFPPFRTLLERAASGRALVWATALLVAACGGGSSTQGGADAPPDANTPLAAAREQAQAYFPPTPIPVDAGTKGMWSPLAAWPLVAVHAVLLPDGRVLNYGSKADGTQTGSFNADVWDSVGAPDTGHLTLPNGLGTDLFCSSQLLLPPTSPTSPASVVISGGDTWNGSSTTNGANRNSALFSTTSNSLASGNAMQRARWYSTSVTLLNGETYIQGGASGTDRPEIRGADGTYRLLSTADTTALYFMYPRNFVQADGRVFGFDSNGAMYFVNPAGSGAITSAGRFAGQYGSSDSSAAMFRPGRILQFGGNSNGALVIDVTSGTPVVTPTQSMASQRRLATATILADGKVVATGGSPTWNNPANAETRAEIWNPQTGQWTLGAAAARPRLYHSNALLLPDASVLVTGGGASYTGPVRSPADNELNAQIYYPPYFFTSTGARATRPTITNAPTWLDIGKTYTVQTGGAGTVSRVVLVKNGSSTHAFNMEQRFVELPFAAAGNTLRVQAPTRAGDATPGFYMLFVINGEGVPSVAHMLRVGVAANPNPAIVPTVSRPVDRSTEAGIASTLQIAATDPNGDALSYTATGLPAGLALDPVTGSITGRPANAGSYNVVVAVSDGVNSASAGFVWTVTNPNPLVLTGVPSPVATLAGSNATFTASASGTAVQYQWRFGDGTPDSAWSSTPGATHVYAAPGSYVVTLSVRDGRGDLQSRSFLQSVFLPATARAPTASTPIVVETPASGNARLWVVNPDNDSITAFDTVTRVKLGEVAVGAAPRAIAVSAGGQLWVTNKRGASVSVVDPASRTVLRTIALPRGSQPYGVAMSPTAAQAFIALEAGGQILKFDTSTYAQTGALAVGANVRHVSVAADGATVYASRFITPPLPGEGTAVVGTPATAGGEVLQINAAAMALTRTVILAHGEKPDAENQGRGIPNYLGPATVSPDGTQAFVPGKQDNIKRGALRDGQALNFQNTVRAISSRIALTGTAAGTEVLARRVDHDNASLASAVAFNKRGTLLFVALETSREIAVVDAFSGAQLFRFDSGRAPQGLALSADGNLLFVQNFMDRSVTVHDLRPLLAQGLYSVPLLATLSAVATDRLSATVLRGKQLFYDARDPRLARDGYMSCASCHSDGSHDGRVWDFTGQGEGLRNTTALRGRAGAQGKLHWSANFDEVQDFEGQIRSLAGGTGLMTDALFNAGTRSQPLGDRKTGQSADLDALAAYVGSLTTFDPSPLRNADGSLSATALSGKSLFQTQCLGCHGTAAFTTSAAVPLQNVGTLKASSGKRLGALLPGIDPPTLRDAWATAPYLHDGSATTLSAAISAHTNLSLSAAQMAQLAAYVGQIGSDEADPTPAAATGTGLTGSYFNNTTLSGTPALTRTENVDFNWDVASPGPGIGVDQFSVRWAGKVVAPVTGSYVFRTETDDGVRVWVNGVQVINNWTDHGPTVDSSVPITLAAGQRADIVMEYYENGYGATARLLWLTPGAAADVAIPASRLLPLSTPAVVPGLVGSYYNNLALSGTPAFTRSENVDFDWGEGSPGTGVGVDTFSVRWTGKLTAPVAGTYVLQTEGDDGMRMWVNGTQMVNDWTDRGPTQNNTPGIVLTAGQQVSIVLEYYENGYGATARLRWKTPGSTSFVIVPVGQLSGP